MDADRAAADRREGSSDERGGMETRAKTRQGRGHQERAGSGASATKARESRGASMATYAPRCTDDGREEGKKAAPQRSGATQEV